MKEMVSRDEVLKIIDNEYCANCGGINEMKLKIANLQVYKVNIINKENLPTDNKHLTEDEAFEVFWKAYPGRKLNKYYTKKIFLKIKPDLEKCLFTFSYMLRNRIWKTDRENIKFIPFPSTFLQQRRWEIDLSLIEEEKRRMEYRADNSFDTK